MRIYSANNVFIEVTRRCNMCCAHCLRGDAESIDIQEKYIDAFLDNFEKSAAHRNAMIMLSTRCMKTF